MDFVAVERKHELDNTVIGSERSFLSCGRRTTFRREPLCRRVRRPGNMVPKWLADGMTFGLTCCAIERMQIRCRANLGEDANGRRLRLH
jgi:hypothetical protein